MKFYALWHCSACETVYRSEKAREIRDGDSPRMLAMQIKQNMKDSFEIHQCSPRIAGVADFAGVEFSEE